MKKLLFLLFMISFISCSTDEISKNPNAVEKEKPTNVLEEQKSTAENSNTQKSSLSATSQETSSGSFPIYRFFDGGARHLYPTRMDYALDGVTDMYPVYEGVLGYVNTGGSVPLYRFRKYADGQILWSINPNETNNSSKWQSLGQAGYVKSAAEGGAPVYRYYWKKYDDHFYTQLYSELGEGNSNGYVLEGIAFFM